MAEWTISKFFSLIIFVVMMMFFFFWMVSQVGDLGVIFGFRTSQTLVNDIASLMTSISGVPGEASTRYQIGAAQNAQDVFRYDVEVSNKIVCVKSYLGDETRFTYDCAAHPFEMESKSISSGARGELCIDIRKTAGGVMNVEGC